MLNRVFQINPRDRQYKKPTSFVEELGYGETSNNHQNTYWRVKNDGHMWLAESCVRGFGDSRAFKASSDAEKWARDYAYSKAKPWGGF
ncbi:hypothetical protein [Desulforamulus aquiferis]|uniref:Uncharacterized protein n=1 Tax=Desulforamulus aquiferis TaxID=1397668 RepID=A0AAW7ZIJ3_9FIRM|nr:hypothetical protein [Desulforamulus aquiferis]MDO7789057.1 hypothetical protein [Desulforamulus aquiferis]